MKSKKTLPVILLAFVVLLVGAYGLYDRLGENLNPDRLAVTGTASEESAKTDDDVQAESHDGHAHAEGEEVVHAPDFTVYERSGAPVKLADYIGKPIVLNFWASWCGPCQSEMPDFNQEFLEIGNDVHFLMVNMTDGDRETVETASNFIQKNGYSFPVFFDTTGEAAMSYGAYSLPTTFFIDASGHVIAQATGAIDADLLKQGISMIDG